MRTFKKTQSLLLSLLLTLAILAPVGIQAQDNSDNPFFKPFNTPFDTIPFDKITPEHFVPAVKEGIRLEQEEVQKIADNPQAPSFANTITAMDLTGTFLNQVTAAFFGLNGAHTSPVLQKIAQEISPLMSAHNSAISLNEKLFNRVKAVYDQRAKLKLTTEQQYRLESTYKGFVRSGALLAPEQKERLKKISSELSMVGLKFGQNLLAETNASHIVVDKAEDLAGLPEGVIAMGADKAKELKLDGKWVFTTQRSSFTPFMQSAQNRALREKLFKAYIMRGDRDNDQDNKAVLQKILALKGDMSQMLGYETPAHFYLETRMAKTPQAVDDFLMKLWPPALKRAQGELAEMQQIADQEGGNFKLAAWDWWFYAEKLRKAKYDLDDNELRPYFSLEAVKKGIFYLCDQLYGIRFTPRKDIAPYHPDVQIYEVKEKNGTHIGVLYMDFFFRPSKRDGAWSGGFRSAYTQKGKRVTPHSTIVCNFTPPSGDKPSLLSMDEASTFFHEFGHALNTLFSNGEFRGRDVPRDSVELPSQIMEHWAFEPVMLKQYARHYQSGAVIPEALIEKIGKSSLFNRGFDTVEYLAACILDMAWHGLPSAQNVNVNQFENQVMSRIGIIPEILPRYRSPYFNHIISGYSAGYYSYIWSEVLDSDAYEAFKETSLFNKKAAQSFRRNILEKLGREDAMTLYKKFRGREPKIEPLLKNRGLAE